MRINSILIVDDSLADRIFLKHDLNKTPFTGEIFESVDGEEALHFLSNFDDNKAKYGDNFPPTLIFLDVNMPKMNGFEFLEVLTTMREERDDYIPTVVVMISSSAMEEDIEKSFSYKCVKRYLVKGNYKIDELKSLLS